MATGKKGSAQTALGAAEGPSRRSKGGSQHREIERERPSNSPRCVLYLPYTHTHIHTPCVYKSCIERWGDGGEVRKRWQGVGGVLDGRARGERPATAAAAEEASSHGTRGGQMVVWCRLLVGPSAGKETAAKGGAYRSIPPF